MEEVRGGTQFNYSTSSVRKLIKVVGVGGGGGNAVTKMFVSGSVPGVSFMLCNTDSQALEDSAVVEKITIGPNITKGLGAGNKPERAAEAAHDSEAEIRRALTSDDTQMVFITAGMGGGTGTGAAPVIGRIAMEAGLLTIGIVTIPFVFEGRRKILQALRGVREMQKSVDALIVVNNERLIDVFGDLSIDDAFDKADETLSNAARGISDMINQSGKINLDFADVQTTLKAGGVAIINTGYGKGENRLSQAIQDALYSPLLNNNNVLNAKRILINVYSPKGNPLTAGEMSAMGEFTSTLASDFENIWGYVKDANLPQDEIAVTILASGFNYETTARSLGGLDMVDPIATRDIIAQEEEEGKLITEYYGDKDPIGQKRYHVKPFLLDPDELDDDDMLTILEETPSLKRDARPLESQRTSKGKKRGATNAPPRLDSHISSSQPQEEPEKPIASDSDVIRGFN